VKGSTNSIIVGLVAVSIGMSFGILLGSLAAFCKGWMDELIMRASDVLYGFPAVLSAILVTSILGPESSQHDCHRDFQLSPSLQGSPGFIALDMDEGFRDLWEGHRQGKRRDHLGYILPNILSPLIVQGTVQFAIAILAEAGLSYLGLGTQPPHASWGRCSTRPRPLWELSVAGHLPRDAPLPWRPGPHLLGDGLRDVLDPRLSRTKT